MDLCEGSMENAPFTWEVHDNELFNVMLAACQGHGPLLPRGIWRACAAQKWAVRNFLRVLPRQLYKYCSFFRSPGA